MLSRIMKKKSHLINLRVRKEDTFFTKHFSAILGAFVGLIGIIVPGTQIWLAYIQKEKEISLAQTQVIIAQTQTEKEREISKAQNERAWQLDEAKFVSEHAGMIFSKDRQQRDFMKKVIFLTFPDEITKRIFEQIEAASSAPEIKKEWKSVKEQINSKMVKSKNPEYWQGGTVIADDSSFDVLKPSSDIALKTYGKFKILINVTDAKTHEPIPGTDIIFRSDGSDTNIGVSGTAIDEFYLQTGSGYSLVFERTGYLTNVIPVNFPQGEKELSLNVRMEMQK